MFFDNVTVEHRQGLQVQENHYDPFGLDLVGLSRSPGLKDLNQYSWNGKEKQAEFGPNWHDHGWRFYDPALGRWVVTDPDAEEADQESWTTYQFGMDNAVRFNDLDGRKPGDGGGTLLEYATGVAAAVVSNITGVNGVRDVYGTGSPAYAEGLRGGDAWSAGIGAGLTVSGAAEVIGGTGLLGASAVMESASLGTATPIAAPTAGAGGVLVASGALKGGLGLYMMNNATNNLNKSSGGSSMPDSRFSSRRNSRSSQYQDVTTKNSRGKSSLPNRETNVSKTKFESNLTRSGYTKGTSKDGKATLLTKGDKAYSTRNTAKSTNAPSADVSNSDVTTNKIRFKNE